MIPPRKHMRRATAQHGCLLSLAMTCAAAACSGGTEPVRLVGGGASGTEPTRPGVQQPSPGGGIAPSTPPGDDDTLPDPTTTTTTGMGAGDPGDDPGTGGGGSPPDCDTCAVALRSAAPALSDFCPGAQSLLNDVLLCACTASNPNDGGGGAGSCLDVCNGFCITGGPADPTCESCLERSCDVVLGACLGAN